MIKISGPCPHRSQKLTAFEAADNLYQWTQVAMGLKGACPYFQRTKVLHGLVYIDDVLTHDKTDPEFRVLDSCQPQ